MTMVRKYRHLKMLKRVGHGHDPAGTVATKPGKCAVLCPECPQPGINLKDGWKKCKFLYRLFLAIDANFCLKRKKVSSYKANPGLIEYKLFLKAFDKLVIQEHSTCSNHKAVDAEHVTKGLAATGVAAVDCVRPNVKRPLAVADLIAGKQYVMMDSVFFGSLKGIDLLEIIVSYNIYPHKMHINADNTTQFYFYIPRFHLPAHIMACQSIFSFNFNHSIQEAVVEANKYRQLHNEFDAGLDPEITDRRRAKLSVWEVSESNDKEPNPFERKFQGTL
ncbi:hypothetical protein B0H34DRAFT_711125 [Crassisporium funariophilum]|nr:hypothetical protein B0H34DRAFT_711125 [Crassisporium funariophilum]